MILKLHFYNSLITEWRIVKRVQEQFQALMTGLYEVIPPELLNVFDEKELELLIGGIAEFDMDDWKKNTEYKNYTVDDQVIKWFWQVRYIPRHLFIRILQFCIVKQCVESFDNEKKARLLQFVTGTSRIPVNGFKDLQGSDGPRKFTIEKTGSPNGLPKSHTW